MNTERKAKTHEPKSPIPDAQSPICNPQSPIPNSQSPLRSLTAQQQRLVAENLGLVAIHLRQNVSNLSVPRREREWDDLFQEGVVGLIQAALRFREADQMPFAAFALPRIRHAISTALRQKFSLVAEPRGPSRDDDAGAGRAVRATRHVPRVTLLQTDPPARQSDDRHARLDAPDPETVGERLREKYERAVRRAAVCLCRKPGGRADRAQLVRRLTQDRLLVPEPEARTALRQIARDTGSSFSRVAQCDKQLSGLVRTLLQSDPELTELQAQSGRSSEGGNTVIDDGLERRLSRGSAEQFLAGFRLAAPATRAQMLYRLFESIEGSPDWASLVRKTFSNLRPPRREALIWDICSDDNDPESRPGRRCRARRRV